MKDNENEVLMKRIGDAIRDFYLERGRRTADGKPDVGNPFQVINAVAAFGGAFVRTAPAGEPRTSALEKFIKDAATHAGFTVTVNIKPMQ